MAKDLDVPPEDYPPEDATQVEIQLLSLGRSLRFPHSTMDEAPLESALFSLQIVVANLVTLGVDHDLLRPLSTLIEALDDLNVGIKNNLLSPPITEDGEVKKGGKRLRSSVAHNMSLAAAAITLSDREHMKEATQRAALKLKIPEARLKTFRRNISTGKITNPIAKSNYFHYINHFKNLSLEKRQDVIEKIMKSLNPIRSA